MPHSPVARLWAYGLLNGASAPCDSTRAAGTVPPASASELWGGTVRCFVVLAVLVLVSVFAQAAHAADPTLVGATASPSTAAPGQPVRLSATLSEPAPAGGLELNLRLFGDWYAAPRIRVLV